MIPLHLSGNTEQPALGVGGPHAVHIVFVIQRRPEKYWFSNSPGDIRRSLLVTEITVDDEDRAAHKFLRLGLNAQACCDNHMQAIIASHLNRKSLAIGISHSGQSRDIVEALELSKIGSATTMCITNYDTSPIVKVSDIALFTKSEETKYSILALSSRIAQLAILDALYTYLVIHTDKAAMNAIYNTEYALKKKKLPGI